MFTLIVILCIIMLLLFLQSYIRMLYHYQRKIKVCDVKNNSDQIIEYAQAPGPFPLPIMGNLALLGKYSNPFEGFAEISKTYGPAFSLTLGQTRCLIVNNLELIREVLNQNGKFFGGRPNFLRYHKIFGGDRNNSLALCDWSPLQQQRRYLGRRYFSPRDSTKFFKRMSEIGQLVTSEFLSTLDKVVTPNEDFELKPYIQRACANMFLQYMSSQRFEYDDKNFQKIVEYFDEVFWEINDGYAVDFLPWLAPIYKRHFDRLEDWSRTVRNFILERIIIPRRNKQHKQETDQEHDFTDMLHIALAHETEDVILFMLEDFIGGHSAIGNLVMIALSYIATRPEVADRIYEEACEVLKNNEEISIKHMQDMPYTMAALFETLRFSSSPIVPHVATEDAVISGFGVSKGTVVFLNNYILNTSDKYWKDPEVYNPERFLEPINANKSVLAKRRKSEGSDSGIEFESNKTGVISAQTTTDNTSATPTQWRIKKNIPQFLPFSIGKRTCVGQSLVRAYGFVLLANMVHKYKFSAPKNSTIHIYQSRVALPTKTHSLVLTPRMTSST